MTVLFYKVEDFYTKNYFEAQNKSNELDKPIEKCFAEFPYIDELEKINELTMDEIIERYEEL